MLFQNSGNFFFQGLFTVCVFSSTIVSFAAEENTVSDVSADDSVITLESILDDEIQSENSEPIAISADSEDGTVSEDGIVSEDVVQDDSIQLARRNAVFHPDASEAPLVAPIRWAKEVVSQMETNVQDYTCTVSKRERINGILGKEEVMEAKIRHEPFSVYLRFNQPRHVCGREAIFVENANQGQLLVHGIGLQALAGTVHLDPKGRMAMKGNRHPVTELGILNLALQLVCVGEQNLQKKNVEIRYFDAQLNGRDCVCVEVMNTDRQADPLFHKAHVYVDMELNLPVKYVSWGWGNGRDCPLMEEYTYSNIRLNAGISDSDFDIRNPSYNYRESH